MTLCDGCRRPRSVLEVYVSDTREEIRLCRECSQARDTVNYYGLEDNCDGSLEVVSVVYRRALTTERPSPYYNSVINGSFNVSGTFEMSPESEAALEAVFNSYMRSQTYGTTSIYTTSSTTSTVDH
jgi:hypothetical protein